MILSLCWRPLGYGACPNLSGLGRVERDRCGWREEGADDLPCSDRSRTCQGCGISSGQRPDGRSPRPRCGGGRGVPDAPVLPSAGCDSGRRGGAASGHRAQGQCGGAEAVPLRGPPAAPVRALDRRGPRSRAPYAAAAACGPSARAAPACRSCRARRTRSPSCSQLWGVVRGGGRLAGAIEASLQAPRRPRATRPGGEGLPGSTPCRPGLCRPKAAIRSGKLLRAWPKAGPRRTQATQCRRRLSCSPPRAARPSWSRPRCD